MHTLIAKATIAVAVSSAAFIGGMTDAEQPASSQYPEAYDDLAASKYSNYPDQTQISDHTTLDANIAFTNGE